MNYILTKRSSTDTIGAIRESMRNPPEVLRYSMTRQRVLESITEPCTTLIRWGTTTSIQHDGYEVNKRESIRLSSNKGKARVHLHDMGIAVPEPVSIRPHSVFYTDKFPLIVRPTFHQRGKDFIYIHNWQDYCNKLPEIQAMGEVYASKFYPKTREYRVHVGHGKVLLVQEKVKVEDTNATHINWNHESGYEFVVQGWKDFREEIVRLAVDTIEAVGLDFGAVDIMAYPTDLTLPIAVVCEINTSPRLEGYTAERYAEYFDWLLNTRETRHFSIPEDTPARHYVFKHRELRELNYDFNFNE